jgi:hypothetical protein
VFWKLENLHERLEAYQNKTRNHNHRYFIKKIDKQFVAYNEWESREYYPLVKKTDYFSKHVNGLISNFLIIRHHTSSLPPKPTSQTEWKISRNNRQ